jgi:uncharacterized protein
MSAPLAYNAAFCAVGAPPQHNDMSTIKFNVAQLLREAIGTRRDYTFTEPTLPLDDTLTMRDLAGQVRFTRTATGVYAQVAVTGVVQLVCVRSLEEFDYELALEFSDQFHSVIDVMTGVTLPQPIEDDPFMLNELHMADIGEAIREYALLELPLNPVSPAYRDQPVSYTVQSDGIDEADTADETDQPADADAIEALKAWAAQHNRKNQRS